MEKNMKIGRLRNFLAGLMMVSLMVVSAIIFSVKPAVG